jgi:hypothetical protein
MTSRDILVAVHWTVCHKNSKHDRFVSGIKLQTRRLKLNGGKNEAVGIEHDSWGSQSSNGTSTSSWRKFQVEVKHSEASRSVVHLEEILWLTTRAKNHVFRARCHTFSGICATISKSWCRGHSRRRFNIKSRYSSGPKASKLSEVVLVMTERCRKILLEFNYSLCVSSTKNDRIDVRKHVNSSSGTDCDVPVSCNLTLI